MYARENDDNSGRLLTQNDKLCQIETALEPPGMKQLNNFALAIRNCNFFL